MSKVADAVDHAFYQPMNKCLEAQRIELLKQAEEKEQLKIDNGELKDLVISVNSLINQGRYEEAGRLSSKFNLAG